MERIRNQETILFFSKRTHHLVCKQGEENQTKPWGLDNVVWVKDKAKLALNSSAVIDWNLTGQLICLYNLKKEGVLFW